MKDLVEQWKSKGWVSEWKARFGSLPQSKSKSQSKSQESSNEENDGVADFFGIPPPPPPPSHTNERANTSTSTADATTANNNSNNNAVYIGVGGMHLLPRRILEDSRSDLVTVHKGTRVCGVARRRRNDNNNNNNRPKNDEELFTEDMRQRKQEFNQRYEHFRGRGRWGGYTLQGIPQVNAKQEAESDTHAHAHATAAPSLSVVAPTSTATSASASTTRNKNTITRTRARKVARKQPMIQIKDIQHYKEEVVDAKDASLVVVRFYASWCKACKAIESSFHRLPQEFPSTVKFVEVPLTKENAYLHKGLGVSSLPFSHIYYNADYHEEDGCGNDIDIDGGGGGMLVDELKISKNKFTEFRRVLRSYVDGECNVYYSSSFEDNDGDGEDNEVITVMSSSPRCRKTTRTNTNTAESSEPEAVPI
mmetsp:Transcript_16685/g.34820  ORF Transcript_16685/g.34820 Transcript_16685/m.34820 type:complete len:421 (+) Transcript_16685:1344-2606(+)